MRITVVLLFLFSVSTTLAQITFTREWVKGKRSTTADPSKIQKDGHVVCRKLVSAVEYLIELEKVRKSECSECHSQPPQTFPLNILQNPQSEYIAYLRDLPSGDIQDVPDRPVPNVETGEKGNKMF